MERVQNLIGEKFNAKEKPCEGAHNGGWDQFGPLKKKPGGF